MAMLKSIADFARRKLGPHPSEDEIRAAVIDVVRDDPGVSIGNVAHLVRFASLHTYGQKIDKKVLRRIVGQLIDEGTLCRDVQHYNKMSQATYLYIPLRKEGEGGGE